MNPPIVALFSSKGGIGRTSLVYHLAWMFAERGVSVLAADLDPQASLTTAFVDDGRLTELWDEAHTVYGCLRPLMEGTGDVGQPHVEEVTDNLGLIVGDLALSSTEEEMSRQWSLCLDREGRAFRVISAFWRILREAALARDARAVLVDVGPNLGAINRAALVAADHVVVPLSPDLFSLRDLESLGPTIARWRDEWSARTTRNPEPTRLALPAGDMRPVGYILMQPSVRLDRPVKAHARWMQRIPGVYRELVLGEPDVGTPPVSLDPHCIGVLKHYRSLMPMAQEARRPMFLLRPSDGAIGAHQAAVGDAWGDFARLAQDIAGRIGLALP